jgi:biofilm PGA synthesis N-glycosyltransferase PgaC
VQKTLLETLAVTLGVIHFAFPLVYYASLRKYANRPWGLEVDDDYTPTVTVIIPTYNERALIQSRLEDIQRQDYPRRKSGVIVVDSSNDGTADVVEEWGRTNCDVNLRLIRERKRRGKRYALDLALERVPPDCGVIVFTDADVFWQPEALSKAVSYLADPSVGAVTANIAYTESGDVFLEDVYRSYYNVIRVAESKVHSTPVHNGPFLAIKAELLRKVGLPMFPGSDDSAFGSFIAFSGYRAIQAVDITVKEPIRGNQALRKIRRAQTLLRSFLMTKQYAKKRGLYRKSSFDRIWKAEWWLNLVNPWVLVLSAAFLVVDMALFKSLASLALLSVGLALFVFKAFRMWVIQQLYVIVAAVRNLWTKEIMWEKPE